MSRIGKMPVEIPSGVDFKLGDGNSVTVKGPNGTLSKELHKDMIINYEGNTVTVQRPSEKEFTNHCTGLQGRLLQTWFTALPKDIPKRLK